MLDRPAYGIAIGALQVVHDRVVPFMDSFFKQCAGEHRRNQHRENERSKERKGHSPGHRMEQAPLDTLQGEDRQVCRDDDGNREKDRALDLVSGVANALHGRPVIATTMPKSNAPRDSKFAGMPFSLRHVAANNSAKGIVRATIIAPRTFPRNRKRMTTTRMMPSVRLCSTVCVV